MAQRGIVDSCVGHAHMGIKAGKATMVQHKVFAVIGAHDAPVGPVIDVVGLAAVLKGDVEGPADGNVVAAHGHGNTRRSYGLVGFVSGQDAVPDRHIGTVANIEKAAIGCPLLPLPGDVVRYAVNKYIGTPDLNAPVVVGIFGFVLIGNGSKNASPYG